MKKLIILIAALMLITTGCQKDKHEPAHNTVVYHGNGGLTANGESSVKDVSLAWSWDIYAKENMFTNGELCFNGWSESADGICFCGPGDQVFKYYYSEYDNCIDLYALWDDDLLIIRMCNGSKQLFSGKTYHFYDSGGPNCDYGNNEDYTYTFYAPSGKRVKIVFDYFHTPYGINYDHLEINGKIHSSLVTVYLSNTLTVKWHSNGSNTSSGWSATVTVVD